MQFIKFISNDQNITQKPSCPQNCDFKLRSDIPIVGIPELQKQHPLLGVIISRDPTTAFIEPYMEARNKTPEGWHNQLMTSKAPPQWLIGQISTFDRKYLDNQYTTEIERLKEVMENNVYWTHIHKCCTDKQSIVAPRFKTKNAELCADKWLKDELSDAIGQGAKFVICVGKDAKSWVEEWKTDSEAKSVQVFYLPHPSGAANGAWNPKDKAKMTALKSAITGLLTSINL